MRRAASIGMLVLYLGLFTEAREIMRLPILVEHYLEHRELVPEMSFLQFIVMHYKTDVPHDSTDMELPFKTCDHSCASPICTIPDQRIVMESSIQEQPEYSFEYVSFIPSSALDEIFQPPRA